jgi:hypothetical protein
MLILKDMRTSAPLFALVSFLSFLACKNNDSVETSIIGSESSVAIYRLKSYDMITNKCAINPQMAVLEDTPIIGNDDISSYSEKEYTYAISANSFAKVKQLMDFVPIAMTVGGKIVFLGVYKPYTSSSTCYHSITAHYLLENQIKFQLGYPTLQKDITIDDQRNNSAIINALKISGRLK